MSTSKFWGGLSFGSVAETYDSIRPDYPAACIPWMFGIDSGGNESHASELRPLVVVDVGAGTGKLTAMIAAMGHEVIAVEPDHAMLDVLRRNLPGVESHIGSAESIPLPDNSVDAIVIAQAFHWVNADLGLPEIARVLKPGGWFGAVWNNRDDNEPWVAELSRLWGDAAVAEQATFDHHIPASPLFSSLEEVVFRHDQMIDADGLVALTASRSYVIAKSEDQRAELYGAIRNLAVSHADLSGKSTFALPYNTHTYRFQKLLFSTVPGSENSATTPSRPCVGSAISSTLQRSATREPPRQYRPPHRI